MYQQQALIMQRRSRSTRRNTQMRTFAAARKLGPVTSTLLLVIMIGMLSLLYLTQITKTSVYGYQINAASESRDSLRERQQSLAAEAARLHSVARIESAEVTAGLVPETEVSFAP